MARAMNITSATFDEVVLASSGPVLVDFWASWCPPCKVLDPMLNQLANAYEGRGVTIGKVQVDQNPALRDRYGIQGVPTFILFVDGEPVAQEVGARSGAQLAAIIDEALSGRESGSRVAGSSTVR